MHAVKQTHILGVCDFHSSVQSTDIFQHGRQSHANHNQSNCKTDLREQWAKRERLVEDDGKDDVKLHGLAQDASEDLATLMGVEDCEHKVVNQNNVKIRVIVIWRWNRSKQGQVQELQVENNVD